MDSTSPNPAGDGSGKACSEMVEISPPFFRLRWFTRHLPSWGLAFIAVIGGIFACVARLGWARYIPIEDLGVKSFLVASCALLLLTLIKLPKWQVASLPCTEHERFDAENEARKTLAQIIGGIGLVLGLYFTSLQLREAQLAASANEQIARDGQITDRYIKAVQQLGTTDAQNLPIRVGAIFSLERIARESKADYEPIMELLSAYVRHRSGPPLSSEQRNALKNFRVTMPIFDSTYLGAAIDPESKRSYVVHWEKDDPGPPHDVDQSWPNEPVPEDIQAAITVIGRRRLEYEDSPWHRINLRFANLRGLDLKGVHLEGADLEGANLQDADFSGSCLSGADLFDALMDTTHLERSDLRRADLSGAVLLNTTSDSSDAREAVILWAIAPSHEDPKKGATGFENADAHGMIIGPSLERPTGAVVVRTEDIKIPKASPFPTAKLNSQCLERSAQIWVTGRGE
jgi:hypothetical protein